jgi:hypothetical protein
MAQCAAGGVFIGTSSWQYPGWRGMLYDEPRYMYRGKFAESRFEKNCLAEYAEVFRTVCVDAGYFCEHLCQRAKRDSVEPCGRSEEATIGRRGSAALPG